MRRRRPHAPALGELHAPGGARVLSVPFLPPTGRRFFRKVRPSSAARASASPSLQSACGHFRHELVAFMYHNWILVLWDFPRWPGPFDSGVRAKNAKGYPYYRESHRGTTVQKRRPKRRPTHQRTHVVSSGNISVLVGEPGNAGKGLKRGRREEGKRGDGGRGLKGQRGDLSPLLRK